MGLPTLREPRDRLERRRKATRSQQLGMLIVTGMLALYVFWRVFAD
jgi:hypothetical protein